MATERTNKDLQKTNDWAAEPPLKTSGELGSSGQAYA